jgi:ubiquitin carboxyl-terminal hydrolase 8
MTDTKGVIGLTNIGNTCYGNAVLQALRHESDLTIFFLLGKHTDIIKRKIGRPKADEDAFRMIEGYGQLIRNMWASEKGVEKTREFWRDMVTLAKKKGYDQFQYPLPHDAHEFLSFLLDQIHEGLAEEVDMTLRVDESKKEVRSALEFWKSSFEKSYSPIVELLFSLKRKSTVCQSCNNESVTWETFNMIDVSVPMQVEPPNLMDLLIADGKGDELDDYVCSGECTHRTKAQVSRSIWRLGTWVIIALKRFGNNGQKVNTPVHIPIQTTFEGIFYGKSIEPSKSHTYELFSTVHHHGVAGGGHYTARAKHPVTGIWNTYDDENTYTVSGPNLLDPSIYIIMYRRVKANAPVPTVEQEEA